MTGTGMPQMRNGAVVTDTGLYFAAGGDNKIRAYDTANGTVLWTGHYSGTYPRHADHVCDRRPAVPAGAGRRRPAAGGQPGGALRQADGAARVRRVRIAAIGHDIPDVTISHVQTFSASITIAFAYCADDDAGREQVDSGTLLGFELLAALGYR